MSSAAVSMLLKGALAAAVVAVVIVAAKGGGKSRDAQCAELVDGVERVDRAVGDATNQIQEMAAQLQRGGGAELQKANIRKLAADNAAGWKTQSGFVAEAHVQADDLQAARTELTTLFKEFASLQQQSESLFLKAADRVDVRGDIRTMMDELSRVTAAIQTRTADLRRACGVPASER